MRQTAWQKIKSYFIYNDLYSKDFKSISNKSPNLKHNHLRQVEEEINCMEKSPMSVTARQITYWKKVYQPNKLMLANPMILRPILLFKMFRFEKPLYSIFIFSFKSLSDQFEIIHYTAYGKQAEYCRTGLVF